VRGAGIGGICEESRDFPGALASARTARHFAVETLQRWGAGRFAGDVALVVAELATNAVLHARSGFTLTLSWRGSGVRVAVRDAVPLPSHTPEPMVLPTRPLHGLGAVAALATKWGADRAADGKTVWAELSPQM
jgi:histidine kinase-like protein